MGETPSNKNPSKPTLFDLLTKYTTRVDERETLWKEGTRACQQQQKAQTEEIGKLKESVSKLQSRPSASSISTQPTSNLVEDKMNVNYKSKWEEAEAKCRLLEKKCQRLETETVKELQTKIDQLQRDCQQMKLIKESIAEICSCRQLTNAQVEQLKNLVKSNNSQSLPVETIANKADFHQQTLKLREIIVKNNEEFLNRIEQMLKRKRKRDQYEDDLNDEDDQDYE